MTARESVDVKAARYLREARLTILRVDGDSVEAECRGTGEVYSLGHDPSRPGGWWCSCRALRSCCHLVGLQSVTVRKRAA